MTKAFLYLMIGCVALAGCQRGGIDAPEQTPPDFSLALCIHVPENLPQHPSYGAIYIIEPCGTFRAATGGGCTINTYPEPTARLSRDQVQYLYRLSRQAGLTSRSTVYDRADHDMPHTHTLVHLDGRRVEHKLAYSHRDYIDSETGALMFPETLKNIEKLHYQLASLTYAIENGRLSLWPMQAH